MKKEIVVERRISDYVSLKDNSLLVIGSEKDSVSLSELEKALDYYEGVDIVEVYLRFDSISDIYLGILTRKEIDPKFLH